MKTRFGLTFAIAAVTAALASKGVEYKHSGDFRGFLGARLRRPGP